MLSLAICPYVLFLVTATMFVGRMEPNEEVLQRILHRCFLPDVKFKQQTCAACQDLHALQF
jgi:hypothetical protein